MYSGLLVYSLLLFFIIFFFCFSMDYFIGVLILIEFLSLSLMLFYVFFYDVDFSFFGLYMVLLGVCEGVLGLSSLVMLVGVYGSDMVGFYGLVY